MKVLTRASGKRIIVAILAAVLTCGYTASVQAVDNPYAFTYEGYLTDNSDNPLSGTVSLLFQIYDPGTSCLLYEEEQVGVVLSNGNFAVNVGSPLSDPKRTVNDNGLTMAQVFANTGIAVLAGPCGAGYTPASGDHRVLRVSVDTGGGVETLSPDYQINSVPLANVAQSVQGFVPGTGADNLVQLDGSSRLPAVDGSLLNNIDMSQVSGIVPGAQLPDPLPAISGANLTNVDAVSLNGVGVSAPSPASQDFLTFNGTNWVNTSVAIGDGDFLRDGTRSMTGNFDGGGFDLTNINNVTASSTSTTQSDSRLFRVYDADTNYVDIQTPADVTSNFAVTFQRNLVFPTGDGSANQVLETDGAGNLSWVTPTDSDTTYGIMATQGLQMSGNDFGVLLNGGTLQVGASGLSVNTVGTIQISDGGVNTVDIAEDAVTSAKIADGTIVAADLSAGAVSGATIVDGSIATADLADSSVTSAKIADGTIVAADLSAGAVSGATIVDGSLATADLADGSVTSAKIADGTIGAADFASGAVDSAAISDGSIVLADLDTSSVDGRYVLKTGDTIAGSINLDNESELRLSEADGNGANYVGFKAPNAVTSDLVWELPDGDGSTGQVLQTDGAGVLSWVTAPGGGEVNTASNQGVGGVPVFITKNAADLEFRSINAGSANVTVTDDGANNEIDIDVDLSSRVAKSGDAMTGALSVTGSADAEQLSIQAHTVQSSNPDIFVLKNSAGTTIGSFPADGTISSTTHLATKSYVDANDSDTTYGLMATPGLQMSGTNYGVLLGDSTLKVDGSGISVNNIGSANIIDGSVTSAKIADGTIGSADFASGAVDSAAISDGSIVLADLDTSSVDGRYVNLSGDTMTGALNMSAPINMSADIDMNSSNIIDVSGLMGPESSGTDTPGAHVGIYGGASTGSGSGGDIRFYTTSPGGSGATVNTFSEAMRIDDDGEVGIGGSANEALHIFRDFERPTLLLEGVGFGPRIRGQMSNAGVTAATGGDDLMRVEGQGFDTGTHATGASMVFESSETWSASEHGSRIRFEIGYENTTNVNEVLRLENIDAINQTQANFSSYDGDYPVINGRRANGNQGTETNITSSGTILSRFSGSGYYDTYSNHGEAYMQFVSDGAWASSANRPTRIELNTRNAADTSPQTRMVIKNDGRVGIGTTSPQSLFDLAGDLNMTGMATPAASSTGEGRIYFDSAENVFKVSENGSAYVNLVGGGGGGDFYANGSVAMTGPLRASAGSMASPSLTFDGDTDTGIWSAGADNMAFSTGGAERVRIDATGKIILGSTTADGTLVLDANGDIGATSYCDELGNNCIDIANVDDGVGDILDDGSVPMQNHLEFNSGFGIRLWNTSGTYNTLLKSEPSVDLTITLPSTAPAMGQVMESDATGNLSWVNNVKSVSSAGSPIAVMGTSSDPQVKLSVGASNDVLLTDVSGTNAIWGKVGTGNIAPDSIDLSLISHITPGNGAIMGWDNTGVPAMLVAPGTAGSVLASTGGGNAGWVTASLGDHTATQNLLMSGFDIEMGGGFISNDGDPEGIRLTATGDLDVISAPGDTRITAKNDGISALEAASFNNNPGSASEVNLMRARGSSAAFTPVQSGDFIGTVNALGANSGAGYNVSSSIAFEATDLWSVGDTPSQIHFLTTPDLSNIPLPRMTIADNGNIGIGTTIPTSPLHVEGDIFSSTSLAVSGASNTLLKRGASSFIVATSSSMYVGNLAGSSAVGTSNTGLGYRSMGNATGSQNVGIGYYNLFNSSGSQNTSTGYFSLYYTTGNNNTSAGYYSGYSNTSGSDNVYIGHNSGRTRTTANRNVLIGSGAGYSNGSSDNVMVGFNSGNLNTGFGNTFVGQRSGRNATGSNNVFIGQMAGYSAGAVSNKLYIANTSTSTPLIYGDFFSEEVTIHGDLDINHLNGYFKYKPNASPCSDGQRLEWDSFTEGGAWVCVSDGGGDFMANGALPMTGNLNMGDNNIQLGLGWLSGDGDNEGIMVSNSGEVQVSSGVSDSNLLVFKEAGSAAVEVAVLHDLQSSFPNINLAKGRGTEAVQTAVQTNDILGRIQALGNYGGNDNFAVGSLISFEAKDNWISGDTPAEISFWTTKDGTTTPAQAMTIQHDGKVGIGTPTPGRLLTLQTASSETRALRLENSGTAPTGIEFDNASAGSGAELQYSYGGGYNYLSIAAGGTQLINASDFGGGTVKINAPLEMSLDGGTNKYPIQNLAPPTDDYDAANKKYVDDQVQLYKAFFTTNPSFPTGGGGYYLDFDGIAINTFGGTPVQYPFLDWEFHVPQAGLYKVELQVTMDRTMAAANCTNFQDHQIEIRTFDSNDTLLKQLVGDFCSGANDYRNILRAKATVDMAPGDYISVILFKPAGGASNFTMYGVDESFSWITIERIGAP